MLMPSQYPELGDRPALRKLLRHQVDMQVADPGTLLRLPLPEHGLTCGCNLTAMMLATNIVAGVSVLFWEASPDGFKDRTQRGPRFKALVAAKYPWCSEDGVDAEFGALLLWDYARNPLSHTLGVGLPLTKLSRGQRDRPAPGRRGGEVEVVYSRVDADGSLREARTHSPRRTQQPALDPAGYGSRSSWGR